MKRDLPYIPKCRIRNQTAWFKDGALVLKAVHDISETFAVEILDDLVKQGFQGQELVAKFKEVTGKVRKAVENMIDGADKVAENMEDDGSAKVAGTFGTEINMYPKHRWQQ